MSAPPRPWALLAVAALLAAWFLPLAWLRIVDGDEGFYLLAARRVHEGAVLYRDLFYTQSPLLPWVYGAWLAVCGDSWTAGRMLAGLLSAGLGALLFHHAGQRWDGRRPAAAVLLYAGSSLVLGWFTLVKTYSLSSLLLFAGWAALAPPRPGRLRLRAALAGACFGGAVATRLPLLAALPALALALVEQAGGRRAALRPAGWFALGACLPGLPCLAALLLDPDATWFGNLGYHRLRSSAGLVGDLPQKLDVLHDILLRRGQASLQAWALVLPALLHLALRARARRLPSSACLTLLALGCASLLPTPAYQQYFCVLIPFGVVVALEALEELESRLGPAGRQALLRGGALACLAWVALGISDVPRYLRSGLGLPNLDHPAWWTPAAIERVAARIDARTAPGEPVLTFWPGYLVSTRARALPGTENPFGLRVAPRLTPAERARYRLFGREEYRDRLRARTTRLVVIDLWGAWAREEAAAAGYRLVERVAGAELWLRPGG